MLRAEYRREGQDSHPNPRANEVVGPALAEAALAAAHSYAEFASLSSLTEHDTMVTCLLEIVTYAYQSHGLTGISIDGGVLSSAIDRLVVLGWVAEPRLLGFGYRGRARRGGCSTSSCSVSWPFNSLNLQSQLFLPQTHIYPLGLTTQLLAPLSSRTASAPTFLTMPTNASRCMASSSLPLRSGRRWR